jgi:hypothetical protein
MVMLWMNFVVKYVNDDAFVSQTYLKIEPLLSFQFTAV